MGFVGEPSNRGQDLETETNPDTVRDELARLLASDSFSKADRMARFLRFVTEAVVLTAPTAGVTMVNYTGTRNGNPYITVSAGALPPGAGVAVTIHFMNPSNGSITYSPVTDSGMF
jgi:hypothetical protein